MMAGPSQAHPDPSDVPSDVAGLLRRHGWDTDPDADRVHTMIRGLIAEEVDHEYLLRAVRAFGGQGWRLDTNGVRR